MHEHKMLAFMLNVELGVGPLLFITGSELRDRSVLLVKEFMHVNKMIAFMLGVPHIHHHFELHGKLLFSPCVHLHHL